MITNCTTLDLTNTTQMLDVGMRIYSQSIVVFRERDPACPRVRQAHASKSLLTPIVDVFSGVGHQ